MSKTPKKVHSHPIITTPPKSGGGLCLLNTMLLCAAPTALVALVVKGARR